MKYLVTVKFVETSFIEAEVWVKADNELEARAGWKDAYEEGEYKCATINDSSIIAPEIIGAVILRN